MKVNSCRNRFEKKDWQERMVQKRKTNGREGEGEAEYKRKLE
jgi:hypothetical protein